MKVFKPLNDAKTYIILKHCYNHSMTLSALAGLFDNTTQATLKKVNALIDVGLLIDDKGKNELAKNLRQLSTNKDVIIKFIKKTAKIKTLELKEHKAMQHIVDIAMTGSEPKTNLTQQLYLSIFLLYYLKDSATKKAGHIQLMDKVLESRFFEKHLDKTAQYTLEMIFLEEFVKYHLDSATKKIKTSDS